MTKREIFLSIILCLIGFAVWIVLSKMPDEAEPWDTAEYYTIGLPLMLVAAIIAGYLEPKSPWRWGVLIVILQPVLLLIQSSGEPLLIVGIITFLFIMLLAAGCAYLGKMLRGYRNRKTKSM